jgi:hypothetical protein
LLFLPLTFKPSDRTHDCYTLIHYYFSNVEVGGNPRLCGFVVCDFVFVYTGTLCVNILVILSLLVLVVFLSCWWWWRRGVEDGRGVVWEVEWRRQKR